MSVAGAALGVVAAIGAGANAGVVAGRDMVDANDDCMSDRYDCIEFMYDCSDDTDDDVGAAGTAGMLKSVVASATGAPALPGGAGIMALAMASASATSCAACPPACASSAIFSTRAAIVSRRRTASSAPGPCQLSRSAEHCSRSTSAWVVSAAWCRAHSVATVLTSATSA